MYFSKKQKKQQKTKTGSCCIESILLTLLASSSRFGLVHPAWCILSWFHFTHKFQIWRPLTAVFYYPISPGTGFAYLINLYFLYSYSNRLETGEFCEESTIYSRCRPDLIWGNSNQEINIKDWYLKNELIRCFINDVLVAMETHFHVFLQKYQYWRLSLWGKKS